MKKEFLESVFPVRAAVTIGSAVLAGLLPYAVLAAGSATTGQQAISKDTRAVIVVTGLRLQDGLAGEVKDLSVAEGALVRLTRKSGKTEEKRTAPFGAGGPRVGTGNFSADFIVDLDATYEITMTFRNGTVIRIDDYRLPQEWRTHFYFHSTRGTKSPASVLRIGRDQASGLSCYVYGVFPLDAYRNLGGRQLP